MALAIALYSLSVDDLTIVGYFFASHEIKEEFEHSIITSKWNEVVDALNNSENLLESTWNCDEEAVAKYKVGDKLNVFVVDVNTDKEKVAFSVREYKRKQQRDEISQYMDSESKDDGAYTLGDMIKSKK